MNLRPLLKNPLFWILILGLAFRAVNLSDDFSGHHAWKEVQLAGQAFLFLEEGSIFTPRNFQASPQSMPMPLVSWVVMIFWQVFGVHEWAARLPMVLFSLGAIYYSFRLGSELYSKRVGYLFALFLAVAPMPVYFGQFVGETSLVMLTVIASYYYFVRWCKTGERGLLYLSALFLMVAVVSKYTPAFMLLPPALYIVLRKQDKILETVPALAVVLVPMAVWFRHASQFRPIWHAPSALSVIIPTSQLFNPGFYLSQAVQAAWGANPVVILLALAFLALMKGEKHLFPRLWFLGGLVYVILVMPKSAGNSYYLVLALLPFLLCAAASFDRFVRREYFWPAVLLIVLVSAPLCYVLYSVEYPHAEAGRYLLGKVGQGETIGWVESAAVCYYAQVKCAYVNSLENLRLAEGGTGYAYLGGYRTEHPFSPEKRELVYVVIPSDFEQNYMTGEYRDHLLENYLLEKEITGKTNLFGKGYSLKTEPQYALIYRRYADKD